MLRVDPNQNGSTSIICQIVCSHFEEPFETLLNDLKLFKYTQLVHSTSTQSKPKNAQNMARHTRAFLVCTQENWSLLVCPVVMVNGPMVRPLSLGSVGDYWFGTSHVQILWLHPTLVWSPDPLTATKRLGG